MEEKIIPALKNDKPSELSSEEFQNQLYVWFEEKGLLTDLRTHLRTQMIKVLKDTTLGKSLSVAEISPKLQALNLLVAEYLLQKEYHYSLSVFSTEVRLNSSFPNFSNDIKDEMLKFRFNDNDTWDILETLGLLHPNNASNIYARYNSSKNESLLNCILNTFNSNNNIDTSTTNLNDNVPSTSTKTKNATIVLERFVDILKEINIHPSTILKVIHQLKHVITTEIKLIKDSKEKEFMELKNKLEEDTKKRVDKYKRKCTNMQQSYERERKRLEVELERTQSDLQVCARSLQNKFADLKAYEIHLKKIEDELNQQKEELNVKDQQIQDVINNKISIDENAKLVHKEVVENVLTMINLEQVKTGIEKAQNAIEESKLNPTSELKNKGQQTIENVDLQTVLLRQNAQQLQLEVNSLREQNANYLSRIQELAIRTTSLIQELEDSRQRVNELNGFQRTLGIIQAPPLTAPSVPTVSYRTRYGIASYNGGGEEGSNVASLSPRQFRNISSNRELRRRLQPRKHSKTHATSSSEDNSPTENILQEARQRLHDLEHESEEIDRHFQEYRSRSDLHATDPEANIMEQFNMNIAHCRTSLNRIFKNTYDMNQPSTSSQVFNYVPSDSNVIFKKSKKDEVRVRNLIADVPINFPNADIEEVFQCLHLQHEQEYPATSGPSSGFIVNTSLSTMEVSSDHKSDLSIDDERRNVKETRPEHAKVENIITIVPHTVNCEIDNIQPDDNEGECK